MGHLGGLYIISRHVSMWKGLICIINAVPSDSADVLRLHDLTTLHDDSRALFSCGGKCLHFGLQNVGLPPPSLWAPNKPSAYGPRTGPGLQMFWFFKGSNALGLLGAQRPCTCLDPSCLGETKWGSGNATPGKLYFDDIFCPRYTPY